MITLKLLLLHRWLGVVSGGFLLVAATTTIGLNHQDWLSARIDTAKQTQGPFDQYVLSAAQDPRAPQHLLMGTHAGLYDSHDGGTRWQPIAFPVAVKQVGTLRFDPQVPGRIHALLRDEGLFASTDDGVTWRHEDLPVPSGTRTKYLALSGGSPTGLTVVTDHGVYRRPDTARTWLHTPRPPAVDREASRKLVQLIYDLHDGQYWGRMAMPITDAVSVSLIVIVLSGYALFLHIGGRKRRRRPRPTGPIGESGTKPLS